jgi:hypothetical protein
MNSNIALSNPTKKGKLVLCPKCQFRITIVNNYASSDSYHDSLLSFNSICYQNEHKDSSSNYIDNLQESVQFCTKHNETIGKFNCIKCNLFFCEKCALEHEKEKFSHKLILRDIKTEDDNKPNYNYNKEMFLEIKKQQSKLIEELIKQVVDAKEIIQDEINQLSKSMKE